MINHLGPGCIPPPYRLCGLCDPRSEIKAVGRCKTHNTRLCTLHWLSHSKCVTWMYQTCYGKNCYYKRKSHMTTIQTITTRLSHGPSNGHVHLWGYPYLNGVPEQCGYHKCQALSVTIHKPDVEQFIAGGRQWGKQSTIRARLRDRFQGPPIYNEAPSDVCSKCGGYSPCNQPSENSA